MLIPEEDSAGRRRDLSKPLLMAASMVAIAIILLMIGFILLNSVKAIDDVGIWDLLTGDVWAPGNGMYGSLPVIMGTFLVMIGAMFIAVPMGIGAAIFLSEVAPDRIRNILKPACEIFAGIPSVIYGFFGLVVIVPLLLTLFPDHLTYGSSWLAASFLLGIMALPTIISVSDDAMRSVPKHYREASIAVGATKWETTRKVVIPAALPGISTAIMLGLGRAIGETMAVMMVAGNAAIIPEPLWNVFSLLRTITATLALEMGETVFGSVHYSALFFLALVLISMVFIINTISKTMVKRMERRFCEGPPQNKWYNGILRRSVRPVVMILTFIFAAMMISLFANATISVMMAFIITLSIASIPVISKHIHPLKREIAAYSLTMAAMGFVIIMLIVILSDIVIKGLPAISWEFLTGVPSNSGRDGGILPAIMGTIELIAGTAVIALPLGIASGIYLAEYSGNGRITRAIRNAIDTLNGTPSIIFGLFGMTAIVSFLGIGVSLAAGCIVLALLILPVIIRTTEEAIRSVPYEMREASAAMGATKWQTVSKVVIPAAIGGVLTGVILSLGRAGGETAPIMFTAVVVSQRAVGFSLFDPIMALPYHLFYLASEVPDSSASQYGTALVLMMIVLMMFLAASYIRHQHTKRMRW